MSIHIKSTCNVAKTFSVKREKADDDTETVVAHLKISDVLIDRDQLDELLRQPIGWSTGALFDDFGAPRARLTLVLAKADWTASGVIKCGDKSTDPKLKLKGAAMAGLSLELTKLGALLGCGLAWTADGDEVDDIADLLGQLCAVDLVLEDGGQGDLLKPASTVAAGRKMTADEVMAHNNEHVRALQNGEREHEHLPRLSSAAEVMKLLQKGHHLRGADPEYWVERPDGSNRQGVWLNAARSALKRGLEPIGDDTAGDEVGRWKWRYAA